MMDFTFAALNELGALVEGRVKAETRDAAITAVQAKGYLLLSMAEPSQAQAAAEAKAKTGGGGRVPVWELVFFAEQLGTLLEGGLPLMRALALQQGQTRNPTLAAAIDGMCRSLAGGRTLAHALSEQSGVFPPLWPAMVRVGETSGKLPQVLGHIAAYLETQEDISSRVTTALVYPCVLAGLSVAVLVFFVVRIVPTFSDIFDSFGAQLPMLTRLIIGGSSQVQRYFFLLAGLLGGLLLIARSWLRTDEGRLSLDRFSRKAPVFGSFFQAVHSQRLVSALALLLESGVEITSALDVLGDVFSEQPGIRAALKKTRDSVVSGDTLSASLARTGVFPTLVTEMAATGEESGKLISLLGASNRYYLKRMDQFLRRFNAVIDPILVVFVGGIVVVVVMAIMMPVISLSQLRR